MQAARIPKDEGKRLAALRSYKILDTSSEQIFDDLVELASDICGVPIALISLVDEERQWFKARKGLDPSQTSREVAFCSHAILGTEVMQVPDATLDHRFADNPLVTNYPSIRFYAGAPLQTSAGHSLGTLCVIDRKPNLLSEHQMKALSLLSAQVVYILESRKERMSLLKQLEEEIVIGEETARAKLHLSAIMRSALDFFVLISPSMEVLAFNEFAASSIFRYLGKHIKTQHLATEYVLAEHQANFILNFQQSLKGEVIISETQLELAGEVSSKVWVRYKYSPAYDSHGTIIGVAFNMVNIQHRKEIQDLALRQNMRLNDIARIQSHELRGPLASILGLIKLIDAGNLPPEDAKFFGLMTESANKLDEVIHEVVKTSYILKGSSSAS